MGKGIASIGWKTNLEEGLGNQGRFHGVVLLMTVHEEQIDVWDSLECADSGNTQNKDSESYSGNHN